MKCDYELMFEKDGWRIVKDDNFPSTNYILYNTDGLSKSDENRASKGLLPCRNMAYCISYESALTALYRELDERKIIDSVNDKVVV